MAEVVEGRGSTCNIAAVGSAGALGDPLANEAFPA